MKKQCLVCVITNCGLTSQQQVTDCPINKFLHIAGGKWSMIVLLMLDQPRRFGELKRLIPDISEKMLITTLQTLVGARYVSKEKVTGKHLKSIYTITSQGKKAIDIAHAMADMGKQL